MIEKPVAIMGRLRNVGVVCAQGDVMTFLDVDCLVSPE